MPHLKEFVPDGLKQYLGLLRAKLRHPDCFIGSPFVGNRVTLGRGCSISRGTEVGNDVRIGDFSYLNCGAIVASGRIGRFCSIGPYVLIGLADHPVDHLSTSPLLYGAHRIFQDCSRNDLPARAGTRDGLGTDLTAFPEIRGTGAWNDFPSPPEIGSDVWIGARAFVRQGVRIGDGAIVGAGAVVTHDVPPYGIVAGVPARLLRYRFELPVIEQLLRLRWWEFDTDELTRWRERFSAPVKVLNILAGEEALP